jgi:hypothetical protein
MPVSVRYIVNDVGAAVEFYITALGFNLDIFPAPGFARLSRGDLFLLLNSPGAGGAGQAMPDGRGRQRRQADTYQRPFRKSDRAF